MTVVILAIAINDHDDLNSATHDNTNANNIKDNSDG